MIAGSAERVPRHTPGTVNRALRRKTERTIACHLSAGREVIDARLAELDREWDIERTLELNASSLALAGLLAGLLGRRRGFLLTAAVTGFLLQHALQGWCPPVALLRRLGFRTRKEIDHERTALKLLRGDFRFIPRQDVPVAEQAAELLETAER